VSSVAHATPPGPGHGAAVCAVASDGKCQAGQHGQAGDPQGPPASTPTHPNGPPGSVPVGPPGSPPGHGHP
jgi:hypothetical protein